MGLYKIAGREICTDDWPKDERTFMAALNSALGIVKFAQEFPTLVSGDGYDDPLQYCIDMIEMRMEDAEEGRLNFGELCDKQTVAGIARIMADYAMEPFTIQAEHIFNYVKDVN